MRLDFFIQYRFRNGTNLFVNDLTTFNEKDRRDGCDTIVNTQVRVMVNIYFTYIDLTIVIFCQFFNNWSDSATRSTPLCPEIYYGQFITIKHGSLEIRVC